MSRATCKRDGAGKRWLLTAALAMAAATLGACGDPNSLDGSIGESLSLEFDRVGIYLQGHALRIEYIKEVHGADYKVVKLVVDTEDLPIKEDTDITGDVFLQRVTIDRIDNSLSEFPDVEGGDVHFDRYEPKSGGRVEGDFKALFVNGRTLHGNFDATVEIVQL